MRDNVQEVEKEVVDDDAVQPAGAVGRGGKAPSRGGSKKRTVTELEYVYEPEMEGRDTLA